MDSSPICSLPDAYSEFSSTENVDKKKELWTDIQNSFSKMKPRFAQQLELTNEAFQNLGKVEPVREKTNNLGSDQVRHKRS